MMSWFFSLCFWFHFVAIPQQGAAELRSSLHGDTKPLHLTWRWDKGLLWNGGLMGLNEDLMGKPLEPSNPVWTSKFSMFFFPIVIPSKWFNSMEFSEHYMEVLCHLKPYFWAYPLKSSPYIGLISGRSPNLGTWNGNWHTWWEYFMGYIYMYI